MESKHKPFRVVEATSTSNKLEIDWEKFDLALFRKDLSAGLTAGTNKAVTSCASNDPNLIDRVVRAHLNEAADHSPQQLQTKKAAKREDESKRAMTQGEATARFK